MELRTLLESPFVLPSSPKVLALLRSELDQETPDLQAVTRLIRTDPALTIRLLQIANADFFRLSGQVNSVSQALAVLGTAHVRAMAKEASSAASLKVLPGMPLQSFWGYSLQVAKLARSLAGVVRQNQSVAYTGGLIHAVGELVMHAGMPEALARLDQEMGPLDLRRARQELREFGYCYAQVGAGLARRWLFAPALADALEHQVAPFDNQTYEPLAGVIHLASWRVRARLAGLNERLLAVSFPASVADILGLDFDRVLQQDPFDWAAHA